MPRYFKKSSWLRYLILLAGLLLAVNIFKAFFFILSFVLAGESFSFAFEFQKWGFRDFRALDKFIFSNTAMILYLSFTYRIGKDRILHERIKERLISGKLSMELALLKSQLNLHFLFNSLNNIYAIALEERAAFTAYNISRLGTLMRYSLHDAQADSILLSKEIDYIEQYMEMQKLRSTEEDQIKIRYTINKADISQQKIALMMLMPFIENAFKYGISTSRPSSVSIELKILEDTLLLQVQNSVHNRENLSAGGIGLSNVQERLRLLYPNPHKLVYGPQNEIFHIHLQLHLQK